MSCGFFREFSIELNVTTDEARLFLDFSDCFEIGSTVEGISSQQEKLSQILGDMSSGKIESFDLSLENTTINNRNTMGNTIS